MSRNRIWVNFSKEFTNEYFLAVKEENFSNLVCKLLREYYITNKTTEDYMYNKLDEISDMLKQLLESGISVDVVTSSEDKEDDGFEVW